MRTRNGGPPEGRRSAVARLGTGLLGLVLLAPGCTRPRVAELERYDGRALPRPDRILVQDFAVSPQEVQLDSGLRGRLMQAFSGESVSQQQYQAARETSAALADAVAEGLRRYGIPVQRTTGSAAPGPGRALLVDGQILSVDEGNRTKRTLIGLGRGMSSVEAGVQLYFVEGGAAPRLLERFDASADSGYAPGAAETMGAGAAAGRLASSAALSGAGHGVLEGRSASDTGEARRIGQAIATRIGNYLVQEGWATPPR
ncbi:MAG TPA: DUF4410 domain-containing protein [Crenalkalicoccus sp.]|nr:DUF4410 domain-containing protein [Crenalkalicoccus sp.]